MQEPESLRNDAESSVETVRYKRATDLILPPPAGENSLQSCADYDVHKLIASVEANKTTGCIRAWNHRTSTRSLMLLHEGRVVGCVYGSRGMQETDTLLGLKLMLMSLRNADTTFMIYDLPENIVLPLASLFLGKPTERPVIEDSEKYFRSWFRNKKQSVCLTIVSTTAGMTYLVFIHGGEFTGAFCIDDQELSHDLNLIENIFAARPSTFVDACVLPDPLDGEPRGHNLSRVMAELSGEPIN